MAAWCVQLGAWGRGACTHALGGRGAHTHALSCGNMGPYVHRVQSASVLHMQLRMPAPAAPCATQQLDSVTIFGKHNHAHWCLILCVYAHPPPSCRCVLPCTLAATPPLIIAPASHAALLLVVPIITPMRLAAAPAPCQTMVGLASLLASPPHPSPPGSWGYHGLYPSRPPSPHSPG